MQIGILEPLEFSQKAKNILIEYGSVTFFDNKNIEDFLYKKDILFIRLKYKIDRVFLDKAVNLKFICTPTTGLNHLDLEEVSSRGVKIISLKGEYEFLSTIRATPEHTIGLLISLLRNYKNAFLNTKNTKWDRNLYKGFEIYEKIVGIIGMGRVGKILSKYFEAFGASVLYTDIINIDAPNKLNTDIELIEQSDIIILTASYSKEYKKTIGKEAIGKMKNKFFINTSRGELVDEEYLLQKIGENHFRGVAIDVINNETNMLANAYKKMLPLCDQHNFILTPHIAGATYESMWRTEEFITEKLIKDLK